MTTTQLRVRALHGLTPFCRDADLAGNNTPRSWRGLAGDVMTAHSPEDVLSDFATLRASGDTDRVVGYDAATRLPDGTFVRQVPGFTYMVVRDGELFFCDGAPARGREATYASDYLVLGHLEAVAA